MGIIYQIYNNINDKVYIGQTMYPLNKRWGDHLSRARGTESCTRLYNAMRKYGLEQFHIKIIEECPNEKLNEREIFWISFYDSMNPKKGYNMTPGGQYVKNPVKKSVYQIDLNTHEIIKEFESAREIERQLGIPNQYISLCCNGKQLSCNGYIWQFKNEPHPYEGKNKRNRKGNQIICLDTKEIFDNINVLIDTKLQKENPNTSRKTLQNHIYRSIQKGIRAYGYYWNWYNK